jgi:methionyl-tRNA formyltransferase
MAERWRIVFFSMALPVVKGVAALVRGLGHEPVAVVTLRPRAEPDAQRFARALVELPPGLDVVIPSSKQRLAPLVRALEPDLVLSIGFNWKIPREVIDIPRLGIVNSHPSLLPRYRGPMPIAWAVRNGDRELGLTYHFMDDEYDTGRILAQTTEPLGQDDAFENIFPKLGRMSAQLLPQVFERLARGEAGDVQDESIASHAPSFEDAFAYVDWSRPRREIHNQVRAWRLAVPRGVRGAIADLDGKQVRVLRTSLEPADGAREVQAGDGPLWILETEPA